MPLVALVAADAGGDRVFEENIRPVLAKNCYARHSLESILAGGNAGPLIAAGKPERSLLMRVLSHERTVKMPPTGKPAAGDVAFVERDAATTVGIRSREIYVSLRRPRLSAYGCPWPGCA